MTGPRQVWGQTDVERHPSAMAKTRVEAEYGTRPWQNGNEFQEPPLLTLFDKENRRLEETGLGERGFDNAVVTGRKEDKELAISPATAQPPLTSKLAAMEPEVMISTSITAEQPTSSHEDPSADDCDTPPEEVNDGGGRTAGTGSARGAPGVRDGAGRSGRSITREGMMRIALELGQAAAQTSVPWQSRTKNGTCITSHDLRSVFMNRVEPDSETNKEVVFSSGAPFHPIDRFQQLYLEEDPDAIITYRWDMCLISELPRFLEPIEEELGQELGREPR
jgi:hypothetical protein